MSDRSSEEEFATPVKQITNNVKAAEYELEIGSPYDLDKAEKEAAELTAATKRMKKRKDKDVRTDATSKENASRNAKPSTAATTATVDSKRALAPLSSKSMTTSSTTASNTATTTTTSTNNTITSTVSSQALPTVTLTSTPNEKSSKSTSTTSTSSSTKSKMFNFLKPRAAASAAAAEANERQQQQALLAETLARAQRECDEHRLMREQYEKELFEANVAVAQHKQACAELQAERDEWQTRCLKQQARIVQLEQEQKAMRAHAIRVPSFCPEF